MHTPFITLLLVVSTGILPAAPLQDRQAILAMAGTHAVSFRFQETVAIAPGYILKTKPYEESATEVVEVVEDTPERIALQHLLVVEDKEEKPQVIKHWAQIWTWQDSEILNYCGSEENHAWNVVKLTPGQTAGTWSQLVTQIDDTPRYESFGKWVHQNGQSFWQSAPTRRPLPRREYTKRDDYDYLLVTNRHTLTAAGWVHEQDNRKVVHREHQPVHTLCHEFGINTYDRTESIQAAVALDWWKEHGSFWNTVREFWITSGENAPHRFAYRTHEGESLSALLERLEEENPLPQTVITALTPFVIAQ